MRPPEIDSLVAHLRLVEGRHPVATVVDGDGATFAGDLMAFSKEDVIVRDPVTKIGTKISLATAKSVRVAALGRPATTFGDELADDETVVP